MATERQARSGQAFGRGDEEVNSSGQVDHTSQGQSAKQAVLTSFAQLGARLKSSKTSDDKLANMIDTIEGEILPRLMLTFLDTSGAAGSHITQADRADFLELVLTASADDMQRFMEKLVSRGVPEEAVLADLLATAAQRLGELWEEDQADFTDVTLGLCRLHEVLRHSSVRGDINFTRAQTDAPGILLATTAEEQHVFGLLMVAEFFRRDGWHVWSEPGADLGHVCDILAREPIDVIGLSIGGGSNASDIAKSIRAVRESAMVPDLKVFVGGSAVLADTSLVERVGADGWAEDAMSAPKSCRALLADGDDDC